MKIISRYQGYSTLGTQWYRDFPDNPVFSHPVLNRISSARKCTVAQVVLSWAILQNVTVFPASRQPEHLRDNLNSAACRLSEGDVEAIHALDGTLDRTLDTGESEL